MSMERINTRHSWNDIVIFLLCGLIAHGLLPLNDGIYFDDWLWVTALKEKNWWIIHMALFESGRPIDAYFLCLFSYFPNIEFTHRLVCWLSIVLSAVLIYYVCQKTEYLSRTEAFAVALISMTYPAFQIQILLYTPNILFYFMLFLLGSYLSLASETYRSFVRYGLHIAACVLLFISFSLNSLLVFYFGFLLVLFLHMRRIQALPLKKALVRFLARRLDYILLPFLYWTIKEQYFPRHGLYADYNQFQLTLASLRFHFNVFFQQAIVDQFREAWTILSSHPVFLLLVFPVAYGVYRACKMERSPFFSTGTKSIHWLIMGLILLACGIFPYAAVGLSPYIHGWNTRHAILLGLPMALIIMGISKLIFSKKDGVINIFGFMFLFLIIIAFVMMNNQNYIAWQARWVKDRSVMMNLAQLENAEKYSVYWVDDQYRLGGGPEPYRFYEYSSMFKQVWGDEKHIGFDAYLRSKPKLFEDNIRYFTARFNLRDFDPAGLQATLNICSGTSPPRSDFKLVARYFYYKFLHPQGMQNFLAGVTQVTVQPIP